MIKIITIFEITTFNKIIEIIKIVEQAGNVLGQAGTYFIQDLSHKIDYTSLIVLIEWSNFALYTIKLQLEMIEIWPKIS